MKKVLMVIMAMVAIAAFALPGSPAYADDASTTPSTQQSTAPAATNEPITLVSANGFTVTVPMETGAVGFWFPADGTFAAGLSHTVLRATFTKLPNLRFDLDATIAQQVSETAKTLGGIGVKIGYNLSAATKRGFAFEPSLGITWLNDFSRFKTAADIFANRKFAVYGTALLYKW